MAFASRSLIRSVLLESKSSLEVSASQPTLSRKNVRPDRVLDVTGQFFALFGHACADRTVDARTKTDFENQLGRFKIWAGSIGVFAAGKASTDFRLRNDESFKQAIDGFSTPVIVEETKDDQTSESADSSEGSEGSLVLSIGGESSATTVESEIPSHHVPLLQDIDSIISKLYRFSAIIRKPTSLQENIKVVKYIDKVGDRLDVTEFDSHVRWQISFRLPDASNEIIDRLANAVVFRRQKLSYRERHQKKLSQGLESAFQAEVLLPKSQRHRSATNAQPDVRASLAGGSNITKSAVARRDHLDVPPPQKSEDTREAICPYCFEIVDKAGMARPFWTRHILKDIDPYVRLFEGCSRPNEQYESLDDWISHMRWQRTLVWSCQAPRHTHLKFETSAECEAHMRQEHIQEISSAQIALLVEKSAQPAADPLEKHLREDETGPQERSVCPLCSFAVENARISEPHGLVPDASAPINGMKKMRDHIAAHLESIAFLSLPEQDELDDAASDEVQSENTKRSSRGADQDWKPLLPTTDAWHEYNKTRWTEESMFKSAEYT
ncbi:MAG: hypothetical protein Q9181_003826 [Wetmoreana brouardii]